MLRWIYLYVGSRKTFCKCLSIVLSETAISGWLFLIWLASLALCLLSEVLKFLLQKFPPLSMRSHLIRVGSCPGSWWVPGDPGLCGSVKSSISATDHWTHSTHELGPGLCLSICLSKWWPPWGVSVTDHWTYTHKWCVNMVWGCAEGSALSVKSLTSVTHHWTHSRIPSQIWTWCWTWCMRPISKRKINNIKRDGSLNISYSQNVWKYGMKFRGPRVTKPEWGIINILDKLLNTYSHIWIWTSCTNRMGYANSFLYINIWDRPLNVLVLLTVPEDLYHRKPQNRTWN